MDSGIIDQVARLARLQLDDDGRRRLGAQLEAILEHFRCLEELDTDGILPAAYAVDLAGRTRADAAALWQAADELLQNAPATQDGSFVVPRILE